MAIDVHTHIVPADFPAYVGRAGAQRWPQMQACDHPGHKTVVIGDKPFRTVSDHSWDVARRLDETSTWNACRVATITVVEVSSVARVMLLASSRSSTVTGPASRSAL